MHTVDNSNRLCSNDCVVMISQWQFHKIKRDLTEPHMIKCDFRLKINMEDISCALCFAVKTKKEIEICCYSLETCLISMIYKCVWYLWYSMESETNDLTRFTNVEKWQGNHKGVLMAQICHYLFTFISY